MKLYDVTNLPLAAIRSPDVRAERAAPEASKPRVDPGLTGHAVLAGRRVRSLQARHRTLGVVDADAFAQFLSRIGFQVPAAVKESGEEAPIPGDVVRLIPVPAQVRDVPAAAPGQGLVRMLIHACKASLFVSTRSAM